MKQLSVLIGLLLLGCGGPAISPSQTVTKFFEAFNAKNLKTAAGYVQGADKKLDYSKSVLLRDTAQYPTVVVNISSEKINGSKSTVGANLRIDVHGQQSMMQADEVELALVDGAWRIVPGNGAVPDFNHMTATIAHLITDPKMMAMARGRAQDTSCESNLHQIAVAIVMFADGNGDVIAATPANVLEKTRPYINNDKMWKCTADSGNVSYSLNPNLAGLKMSKIKNPAETVLLYEGHNGKLGFRHDGGANVAFADSHVKRVTEADSKKLRWKP